MRYLYERNAQQLSRKEKIDLEAARKILRERERGTSKREQGTSKTAEKVKDRLAMTEDQWIEVKRVAKMAGIGVRYVEGTRRLGVKAAAIEDLKWLLPPAWVPVETSAKSCGQKAKTPTRSCGQKATTVISYSEPFTG